MTESSRPASTACENVAKTYKSRCCLSMSCIGLYPFGGGWVVALWYSATLGYSRRWVGVLRMVSGNQFLCLCFLL